MAVMKLISRVLKHIKDDVIRLENNTYECHVFRLAAALWEETHDYKRKPDKHTQIHARSSARARTTVGIAQHGTHAQADCSRSGIV